MTCRYLHKTFYITKTTLYTTGLRLVMVMRTIYFWIFLPLYWPKFVKTHNAPFPGNVELCIFGLRNKSGINNLFPSPNKYGTLWLFQFWTHKHKLSQQSCPLQTRLCNFVRYGLENNSWKWVKHSYPKKWDFVAFVNFGLRNKSWKEDQPAPLKKYGTLGLCNCNFISLEQKLEFRWTTAPWKYGT